MKILYILNLYIKIISFKILESVIPAHFLYGAGLKEGKNLMCCTTGLLNV